MSGRHRSSRIPRGVLALGALLACLVVLWVRHAGDAHDPPAIESPPRAAERGDVRPHQEGVAEPPPGPAPSSRTVAAGPEAEAATAQAAPTPPASAPVAKLQFLAVDHAERPVPSLVLLVERALPDPSGPDAAYRLAATTDLNGRAELEVPADVQLAVHVGGVGRSDGATRWDGDRPAHDPFAAPLVLERGETRELVARLGATVSLRGRVLLTGREPVPAARIRILEGAPEEQGWHDSRMELNAGPDGRFEALLRDVDPATELTVIAVDGEFLSIHGEDLPAHATTRWISVAAWLDDPQPLELVLDPLGKITGRVVDAAGDPVNAVVWAVEPGEPYVLAKGPLDFVPIVVARGPEEFELGGLVPGVHDVIVKRDSPRTYHRFPGVRTGAPAREFVLEGDRHVVVRVVVAGAREGDRGRVLLLRHQARQPATFGAPAPAGTVRVDACAETEWARANVSDAKRPPWTNTTEHEDGRTIVRGYPVEPAGVHELEPQQAGCYSVGFLAWDRDGRPYARRLSPPYHLSDGPTTFAVSLAPTATLIGAGITGPGPGLEVEVRDVNGEVVLTPSGARTTPVTAQGSFRVEQVPPGTVEVRLGTAADLRAGEALRSVRLYAAPGEVEVVFP